MSIHPEDLAVLNETRRQFFARGARGLGVAALSSMFASAATEKQATGLEGLPHFPPKIKSAIYLHMVGAPPQMDLLRLQAEDEGLVRQGSAGVDSSGPAADDHDVRAEPVPDRAVGLQVRAARASRRMDLGAASRHVAKMADDLDDHPLDEHRGDQSRAGDHVHSDRQSDRGQTVCRFLDGLRLGKHESGSADVRGAECEPYASESERAGDLGAACGARDSFRRSMRASRCVPAATRCCTSTIPTECPLRCVAGCWTG